MKQRVVCYGEVLWDNLPDGMFLGGAPLNVALSLNNLGIAASIISAVGEDELGRTTLDAIRGRGMEPSTIQRNEHRTGLVDVAFDELGNPEYTILRNVAWDHIRHSRQLSEQVKDARYLVAGSLVMRSGESAATLRTLLQEYKGSFVVDINLRSPFYDEQGIDELLNLADIVKLNKEELNVILSWKQQDNLTLPEALEWLSRQYHLKTVLYTRGASGSVMYTGGELFEEEGYKVEVKDTVGAGDAFLAGSLFGLLNEYAPDEILRFANATGAFVASHDGATPDLDLAEIKKLANKDSRLRN